MREVVARKEITEVTRLIGGWDSHVCCDKGSMREDTFGNT